MFGTVLPLKDELTLREFKEYRSFYCGICQSIKKRFGNVKRLVLNFDFIFLAILLSAINDDNDGEKKQFRCLLHPLEKKEKVISSKEVDYAADMLIILSYYNLLDDYNDDKKIFAKISANFIKSGRAKKLFKTYAEKIDTIEFCLKKLSNFEKENNADIDEVSIPFAELLGEIFVPKWFKGTSKGFALQKIGFSLGKWIYLVDAIKDYENDKKKKSYNPILANMLLDGIIEENEFEEYVKEKDVVLKMYISDIEETLELLSIKEYYGIIENIIKKGMPTYSDSIVEKIHYKSNTYSQKLP